jgi:PhzF family phenazine biosynthesis protein
MQRFARWTNLSETTFLLPPRSPEADYRVRIFTPGGELPFAGHPTLGSCHAWLEAGGRPRRADTIVQECQVGLVPLRREPPRLAFAAPPLRRSEPDPSVLRQVLSALGLQAQQVLAAQRLDNGPVWLGLLLDTTATVLALSPDHAALRQLGEKVGVAAIASGASATARQLEVRAFAAPIGITEDPVTGSLNASLAQWLITEGRLPARYVAAQGACLDRAGRVNLQQDADAQVWVGGESVTCITGTVRL